MLRELDSGEYYTLEIENNITVQKDLTRTFIVNFYLYQNFTFFPINLSNNTHNSKWSWTSSLPRLSLLLLSWPPQALRKLTHGIFRRINTKTWQNIDWDRQGDQDQCRLQDLQSRCCSYYGCRYVGCCRCRWCHCCYGSLIDCLTRVLWA